jgi:BirA family biotin operon repressor/biotin-[acetyl-CoA-carboxylase] ligase
VKPYETWNLKTQRIGKRTWRFASVASTNTLALELLQNGEETGLVVLADYQTAGRGRLGRAWHAPAHSAVLLSVALRNLQQSIRPSMLTAWVSLAVCRSIEIRTGLRPSIKWPNDVLIDARKVCGILIEQHGQATVAGIGLNVAQTSDQFAQAGLSDAVSLTQAAGSPFDSIEIARLLIHELDRIYTELETGDVGLLESGWRDRVAMLGRQVELCTANGTCTGTLRKLAFHELELVRPGLPSLTCPPEAVLHLHAL